MRLYAITLVAMLAGAPVLADPLEGTWQTRPTDNGQYGHVKVVPCGPAFCGTLVKAFDSAGNVIESPNIGKRIVWDMQPQGGGAYGDGKIWAPDRDKTYAGKMKLSGNKVAVSGCVMGICRDGGSWSRVN